MTITPEPDIYVDLYKSHDKIGRQAWRWRATSAGNNRKLASSGEAYTNEADALSAVQKLFGEQANVVLRNPDRPDKTDSVLRTGGSTT